jgi:hypothetical protein
LKSGEGLSTMMGEDVRGTDWTSGFRIKGTKWFGVQILSGGRGMVPAILVHIT